MARQKTPLYYEVSTLKRIRHKLDDAEHLERRVSSKGEVVTEYIVDEALRKQLLKVLNMVIDNESRHDK